MPAKLTSAMMMAVVKSFGTSRFQSETAIGKTKSVKLLTESRSEKTKSGMIEMTNFAQMSWSNMSEMKIVKRVRFVGSETKG